MEANGTWNLLVLLFWHGYIECLNITLIAHDVYQAPLPPPLPHARVLLKYATVMLWKIDYF